MVEMFDHAYQNYMVSYQFSLEDLIIFFCSLKSMEYGSMIACFDSEPFGSLCGDYKNFL